MPLGGTDPTEPLVAGARQYLAELSDAEFLHLVNEVRMHYQHPDLTLAEIDTAYRQGLAGIRCPDCNASFVFDTDHVRQLLTISLVHESDCPAAQLSEHEKNSSSKECA